MTVSVVCGAVRVCRLVQASTATWPYTGCGVVAERSGVPCVCGSRRHKRAPGDAGAAQLPDATHTCAPGWWPPVVVANGCHRSPTAGDPVLAGGFARTAAVAHSGPTCHRSRHHTYWASGGETPG